jgi:hypothetical protein
MLTTNYNQAKANAFKNSMFGVITASLPARSYLAGWLAGWLTTLVSVSHEIGLFRELVKKQWTRYFNSHLITMESCP